jgi:hypothetical protein
MILTWLWKMFLAFRRGRETAALETAKGQPALGEARADFINDSNDRNNAHVVIFDAEEPETAAPAK